MEADDFLVDLEFDWRRAWSDEEGDEGLPITGPSQYLNHSKLSCRSPLAEGGSSEEIF